MRYFAKLPTYPLFLFDMSSYDLFVNGKWLSSSQVILPPRAIHTIISKYHTCTRGQKDVGKWFRSLAYLTSCVLYYHAHVRVHPPHFPLRVFNYLPSHKTTVTACCPHTPPQHTPHRNTHAKACRDLLLETYIPSGCSREYAPCRLQMRSSWVLRLGINITTTAFQAMIGHR